MRQLAPKLAKINGYKSFAQAVLDGPMTGGDTVVDGMMLRAMAKQVASDAAILTTGFAAHALKFHDVRMRSHDLPEFARLLLDGLMPLAR
jgi:hypothetical protein